VDERLMGESNSSLRAWRTAFVLILVILGGYAGFELGSQIVFAVTSPKFTPSNWFISSYREILMGGTNAAASTGGAVTAIVLFTLLGVLVSYLISTTAFNRLVGMGDQLRVMPATEKLAAVAGVVLGAIVTCLVYPIVSQLHQTGIVMILMTLILVAFIYLGVVIMTSMKDELPFWSGGLPRPDAADTKPERCKILDTNVIIDGRVADICRTGFIEGPIYVPGFVLDELQHIADSSDSLKRARGRRGLDILNQMRTELKMMVRTYDNTDPNDRDEVDAKLVKLAKELGGVIVTNDFNLNKVAELQGVQVLNINELANALKPVVLPGEEMTVTIIKEGKEINQGVAYLDDGTMIVVEGARRRIGETLEVVTSSVLQTVAGKMIFASIRNNHDDTEEDDGYDRHLRSYRGGGPRRKIQH
jgi:uncharacterized protein YacL